MSKLTDEQITGIWIEYEGRELSWRRLLARAIESAATEPLLQRIAELEQNNRDLSDDVQRFRKHAMNEKAARLELERQLEEARNQMEAQKDEWLSWEAKRKALEKDAERYRWLVAQMMHPDADHQEEMFNRLHAINPDPANAKEVDAAIEAAMQKGQS